MRHPIKRIFIGVVFLLCAIALLGPVFNLWPVNFYALILVAALLVIGCALIFGGHRHWHWQDHFTDNSTGYIPQSPPPVDPTPADPSNAAPNPQNPNDVPIGVPDQFAHVEEVGGANFRCHVKFTNHQIKNADAITSGDISSDFGSLTVDLTEATLPADVHVKVGCSFGQVVINAPRAAAVAVNGSPFAGQIRNQVPATQTGEHTVTFDCACTCGNIVIQ